MVEIRTANIRRESRRNVNSAEPAPAGPAGGYYCEEYTQALLRIMPAPNATYELTIWTYEDGAGSDWIEDPSERRALPAGQDYTRMFRCGPVDRMDVQITAKGGAGPLDIFWTFA